MKEYWYECEDCGWVGQEEELGKKYVTIRGEPEPEICCPLCRSLKLIELEGDTEGLLELVPA